MNCHCGFKSSSRVPSPHPPVQRTEPAGNFSSFECRRGAGSATDRPYVIPQEAAIEFNTHGFNGMIDFGEPDAEEWMSCQVRIRVPGFEANYACNVQRPELELLRAELARLSRSVGNADASADWSAMEMGISLRFKLNRLGQIKGGYELRSRSDGPSLSGDFEADQTHLGHWLSELDQVLGQPAAG
jgi:hypothetical protein